MSNEQIQGEAIKLVNYWEHLEFKQDCVFHVSNFLKDLIHKEAEKSVRDYRESVEKLNSIFRRQRKREAEEQMEQIEDYIYENKNK